MLVTSRVARYKPVHKAALLLHALSPEATSQVPHQLTARQAKALSALTSALPHPCSVEALAVIHEFFHLHCLWPLLGGDLRDSEHLVEALETWARTYPHRLAALLHDTWLLPRD